MSGAVLLVSVVLDMLEKCFALMNILNNFTLGEEFSRKQCLLL
jgi:hypothetical protein